MKSPWRVTMQYINGKSQYAVYRLRDMNAVDHSGNRESGSNYMDSKAEAERIAAELNAKEAAYEKHQLQEDPSMDLPE